MRTAITALCVCVGDAPSLELTLPSNRRFFDRFVVVTNADDVDTIALAVQLDATVVIHHPRMSGSAMFERAAALNEGLCHVTSNLVCVLSADCMLPQIDWSPVRRSRDVLWGMDRIVQRPDAIVVGPAIDSSDRADGYFSAFNRRSRYYPGGYDESVVDHHDVRFICSWPPSFRRHGDESTLNEVTARRASARGSYVMTGEASADDSERRGYVH